MSNVVTILLHLQVLYFGDDFKEKEPGGMRERTGLVSDMETERQSRYLYN